MANAVRAGCPFAPVASGSLPALFAVNAMPLEPSSLRHLFPSLTRAQATPPSPEPTAPLRPAAAGSVRRQPATGLALRRSHPEEEPHRRPLGPTTSLYLAHQAVHDQTNLWSSVQETGPVGKAAEARDDLFSHPWAMNEDAAPVKQVSVGPLNLASIRKIFHEETDNMMSTNERTGFKLGRRHPRIPMGKLAPELLSKASSIYVMDKMGSKTTGDVGDSSLSGDELPEPSNPESEENEGLKLPGTTPDRPKIFTEKALEQTKKQLLSVTKKYASQAAMDLAEDVFDGLSNMNDSVNLIDRVTKLHEEFSERCQSLAPSVAFDSRMQRLYTRHFHELLSHESHSEGDRYYYLCYDRKPAFNSQTHDVLGTLWRPLIEFRSLFSPPLARSGSDMASIRKSLREITEKCRPDTASALNLHLVEPFGQQRNLTVLLQGASDTDKAGLAKKLCRAMGMPVQEATDLEELFSVDFMNKIGQTVIDHGRSDIAVIVNHAILKSGEEGNNTAKKLLNLLRSEYYKCKKNIRHGPSEEAKGMKIYPFPKSGSRPAENPEIAVQLTLFLLSEGKLFDHKEIKKAVGPGESFLTLLPLVEVFNGGPEREHAASDELDRFLKNQRDHEKMRLRALTQRGEMDPAQADREWAEMEAHQKALRRALTACLPHVKKTAERSQWTVGQVRRCVDVVAERLDRHVCDNPEASLSEDDMRSLIDQHSEQSN